ncbi:hypothetical protein GHK69_36210, partial [Sinorhizobium meliloti]
MAQLEHIPTELRDKIADQLSPIDLLMLSRSNRRLRDQLSPALQQRAQRAARVQFIWDRLTQPGDASQLAALVNPGVIESIARNFDCLTEVQQEYLVLYAEGLVDDDRALVLGALGTGVAELAPAIQQRLIALIEGLDARRRASALQALGASIAGLAPELQQRLVALI